MEPATNPSLTGIRDSTERLLASASDLTDADMRAPSTLPGWSRGHVLSHLARNADAMANLLRSASTGVEAPAYLSHEVRNADIEAGAGLPAEMLIADVRESAEMLDAEAEQLSAAAWSRLVRRTLGSDPFPATEVLPHRRREVEIHHVDLNAGYHPRDWPAGFVAEALPGVAAVFAGRESMTACWLRPDGGTPVPLGPSGPERSVTIAGPAWALLAWLLGRRDGAGLIVSPARALPDLPPWN